MTTQDEKIEDGFDNFLEFIEGIRGTYSGCMICMRKHIQDEVNRTNYTYSFNRLMSEIMEDQLKINEDKHTQSKRERKLILAPPFSNCLLKDRLQKYADYSQIAAESGPKLKMLDQYLCWFDEWSSYFSRRVVTTSQCKRCN